MPAAAGGTTDSTIAVAEYLLPSIKVVHQTGRGKGDALRAGFDAATSDIIVMIDADGSTQPSEIPAFVEALVDGADFVKGSRFAAGGGTSDMSHLRRLGNWGFTTLVKVLFGGTFTDLCYGFCAFHRRYLEVMSLQATGFEIEAEMTVRAMQAGLRVAEVPSMEMPRRYGTSNLRAFRDGIRVLRTVLRDHNTGVSGRVLQALAAEK